MCRISLVNMPFADCRSPCLALTQLRSIIQSQSYSYAVSVDIAYANLNFASFLGRRAYESVSFGFELPYAGFGDWLFRRVAFPGLTDNTAEYFECYLGRKKADDAPYAREIVANHLSKMESHIDSIIDLYSLDKADIVGMTSTFMQNVASFALARLIKKRNPAVVTVIGGSNCQFPMGQIIADQINDIDYVFSGPALKSFPSFIEAYLNQRLPEASSIPGVLTKRSIDSRPKSETIGDDLSFDTMVEIDYSDFLQQRMQSPIYGKEKAVYHFETSRGCWWGQRAHCTFCGLNGESMAYRAMSPSMALEQFRKMFQYSSKFNVFMAIDNICPKNYFTDVFPHLETPSDSVIFYEVKADLSESDIANLERAGVRRVQPGIESLITSTLKEMRKGTTAPQNINLLKLCTLYGVKPQWNLLVGFPGERAAVYRRYLEILPLVSHLEPPSGVFSVRYDRFSPYHNHPENYGLDLHPMKFYSFIYPFDTKSLNDFAYYFSDGNVSSTYLNDLAEWIGKLQKAMVNWQDSWSAKKGGLAADLYFRKENNSVVDTRSGVLVEHSIGREGIYVLECLNRALRKEELSKLWPADQLNNLDTIMKNLIQKGLLFQEGDRFLSLVLDGPRGSYAGRRETVTSTSAQSMPVRSESLLDNNSLVILS